MSDYRETQMTQLDPGIYDREIRSAGAARPRDRVDLGSLRDQIGHLVSRAEVAGHQLHNVADGIFGSRPELASEAQATSASPTIADHIGDLARAMSRIESALERL